MTDQNEAPERIWAAECRQTQSTMWWPDDAGGVGVEYIRKDHTDAKDKRITELEALVTHMTPFAKMGNWAASDLFDYMDLEASEIFDAAKNFDLLDPIPGGYDPDQHYDEYGEAKSGDPWYSLRNLRLPEPIERASLTDQTEMPEMIWATGCGLPAQEESGTFVAVGNKYPTAPNADALSYIRKDLSDAKDKRIKELEAKLATATDGLRECEGEIDQYIRQEYPGEHPVQERYRQRDFAANPARTTLAELKGPTQ